MDENPTRKPAPPQDDEWWDPLHESVRRRRDLTAAAKVVFVFVRPLALKGRPLGQRLIADECGMSKSAVQRALAELVEAGLLERVGERGRRSTYRVVQGRTTLGSDRSVSGPPVVRQRTRTGPPADHDYYPREETKHPPTPQGGTREGDLVRSRFERIDAEWCRAFDASSIGRLTRRRREAIESTLDLDDRTFERELRAFLAHVTASRDDLGEVHSPIALFATRAGSWATMRRRAPCAGPVRVLDDALPPVPTHLRVVEPEPREPRSAEGAKIRALVASIGGVP